METSISSDTLSNTLFDYLNTPISTSSWVFWLLILLFVFFLLWIFFGRGDYEYIGLSPMKIGVDSTRYINGDTYAAVERSNLTAKKITGDNPSPTVSTNFAASTTVPSNNSQPIPTRGRRISKGERICREVLEDIYKKPFPCVRPNFLKNPETKRNLELDCYNEELKLAVEYNGIQHYKWPNFTGQTKEAFIKQVRRDRYKVDTCDANGVYLITVPYNVPHDRIRDYILYYLPENYNQRIADEQNGHCFVDDSSDSYEDDSSDSYKDDSSESYEYDSEDELTISFVSYE